MSLKIFVSTDRASKTEQMINWLCGNHRRVLLTVSHQECDRLREAYFFVAHRILPWDKRDALQESNFWEEVGIDDVDLLLRQEVPLSLGAIGAEGEAYASKLKNPSVADHAWKEIMKARHTVLSWVKNPEPCSL